MPAEVAKSSLLMLGSWREGPPNNAQKPGEVLYEFAGRYLGNDSERRRQERRYGERTEKFFDASYNFLVEIS